MRHHSKLVPFSFSVEISMSSGGTVGTQAKPAGRTGAWLFLFSRNSTRNSRNGGEGSQAVDPPLADPAFHSSQGAVPTDRLCVPAGS
jgi:hypothetical protein